MPTEKHDRVNHIYNTYKHILEYLSRQNAYLPHVRPKYLLKYDEYVLYETKIREILGKKRVHTTILSEKTFFFRSRQSWVDVLLQVFNVFVLSKIARPRKASARKPDSVGDKPYCQKSFESIILTWLTRKYNSRRHILVRITCDENIGKLPDIHIENFTTDLSDALVLITLILAYCPYMEKYLENIYVFVDCYEKAFHNASKLIKTLKQLNISYEISPSDIAEPTCVNMMMFLVYCYEVLPYMFPQNTVNFVTSLSTQTEEVVTLKNTSNFKAIYKVIFINNELDCFKLDCEEIFSIPPGKNLKVTIKFMAKKTKPVNSTLIFSGETKGERYSTSIVFTLIGEYDFEKPHCSFCFDMDLYTLKNKTLKITAPYIENAEYTYQITYTKPEPNNLELCPRAQFVADMKLKLICIYESTLQCQSNGVGYLNVTLASFIMEDIKLWILFTCEDIGQFFIEIELRSSGLDFNSREVLYVDVPQKLRSTACICEETDPKCPYKCGRFLQLEIPRKNTLLWKNIWHLFSKSIPECDVTGWGDYLGLFLFIDYTRLQPFLLILM